MIKNLYGGDNLSQLSDIRYLPRWVVFMIDILLLIFSIYLSYLIINRLHAYDEGLLIPMQRYTLIVGINIFFMYIFRTFAGIIRHSTFIDLFKLLLSSFFTFLVLFVINIIGTAIWDKPLMLLPFLWIYFAISLVMLFLFRLFVKEFFHMIRDQRTRPHKTRILVLGIGEQSIAVARAIIDNPNLPYQVVGFLTQRTDSKKAILLGKPIFVKQNLSDRTKEQMAVDGVLIIKELLSRDEMNMWVNVFLEKDLKIFKAPSVQKVRERDLGVNIRTLQIEDLLNRKPIKIENEEVKRRHFGKTVLVTGGAGSIGSEIVYQVAQFNPSLIVVVDQAETPLYDVELRMKEKYPDISFKFVLADISNKNRIEPLFEKYSFSMVYHAAAYKHVPLIEENPHEGVLVNIFGTKTLANLACKYKVNRFVMVSTDKAVNPTNVMGATKRAAELYVQSLQHTEGNITKFITTRFGNVLGSNGSVIPHFKRQIENGGPITITHPDIVRYFMTIPEACELVLEAGIMGSGGEIFVFDMGEPVRILDLARRMIKLSGLVPEVDIKIVYTGLRPGEKLYEELLSDGARSMPTHHEKIMISKDQYVNYPQIDALTNEITKAAMRKDKMEVVRLLKNIVSEFKSNNSVYEDLDK